MKNPARTTLAAGICTSLLVALCSAMAHAQYPPVNDYACQVQTGGNNQKLVLVQANSHAEAVAAATRARVSVAKNVFSKVTKVVECIEQGKERFRDSAFQGSFEETEL